MRKYWIAVWVSTISVISVTAAEVVPICSQRGQALASERRVERSARCSGRARPDVVVPPTKIVADGRFGENCSDGECDVRVLVRCRGDAGGTCPANRPDFVRITYAGAMRCTARGCDDAELAAAFETATNETPGCVSVVEAGLR